MKAMILCVTIGAVLFASFGAATAAVSVATAQPFAAYLGLKGYAICAAIGGFMGLCLWASSTEA
jgi:hypothetical protein